MLVSTDAEPHILDPGAGVGSLFAASVAKLCTNDRRPSTIRVTAYEIDPQLANYARMTLHLCKSVCGSLGVVFDGEVIEEDFLGGSLSLLGESLFTRHSIVPFTIAVLNPPYRKIQINARERRLLRQAGIETTNLYTGFMGLAMRLLAPGGEFVSITPRSFCNGAYFNGFRHTLFATTTLRQLHLFESRQAVFGDAMVDQQVLQETIILSSLKRTPTDPIAQAQTVRVTMSEGADDAMLLARDVPYEQVVQPGDAQAILHVSADEIGRASTHLLASLPCTLADLGLNVSTDHVVDFRSRAFLRQIATLNDAPLIYPAHLTSGQVVWPNHQGKKPNALVDSTATQPLLIPNATYVLVKRFSSKEEKRRIVAIVYEGGKLPGVSIGIENHLNYIHSQGKGIEPLLARGLAAYLNSTLVDLAFRQFSGHTQVNAGDLRSLRYPTQEQLQRLGAEIGAELYAQTALDALIREELTNMVDGEQTDPTTAKQRIDEALAILKALGFPRQQQNERSALTLLALLDVPPEATWGSARNPLRGVTPLMDFISRRYDKTYAPNTRETVRRQTIHQFLDAALVRINPDDPNRPVNSGQTVYQIEDNALALLRAFGSSEWVAALGRYRDTVESLKERYAQERLMARIPLRIAAGKTITGSPGGQNTLVERIIHDIAERFFPDGTLVYVGDAEKKFAYLDADALLALGVRVEAHGKMPDVIIYDEQRNSLALIEAVTSHGPISAMRKGELVRLFGECSADLVFLTAFLTRRSLTKYIDEIAWETEVWLADAPSHLIHFDGDHLAAPR